MQADARVFRQAAATARSGADEIDELEHRMQADDAHPADAPDG
jgi:hypothetical protein